MVWYKVVGGWGVDGITIFQKGFPLAFNNAIPNYTASFGGGSRPNVVAGGNKSPGVGGSEKLGEWFVTSCFTAPADFTYGKFFNIFNRNPWAPPKHFCWQLNLRPGIQYLPRHEPAPHPVRTEIHVLDLQTHGLAVQAYPSRAVFPSGTVIAHSHFSPRNPYASCLGLANSRVLKYNLHWLSEPRQGDSRSYGSPIYPA
jgi:hypothetical protein